MLNFLLMRSAFCRGVAYNTSKRNSKFNVSDASALFFFSHFLSAQNMVLVVECEIIEMI